VGLPAAQRWSLWRPRLSRSGRSWVLLPIAWITRVIVRPTCPRRRSSSGMRSAPGPRRNDDELPGPADLGNSGSLDDEASTFGDNWRFGDYRCIHSGMDGFRGNVL